jgi:hypothetical protein
MVNPSRVMQQLGPFGITPRFDQCADLAFTGFRVADICRRLKIMVEDYGVKDYGVKS